MITSFTGKYDFLSNFYPVLVCDDMAIDYPSVEHAYQAAKSTNPETRYLIRDFTTAAEAKKRGRIIRIRAGWNDVKLTIMLGFLRQKFGSGALKQWLLATGNEELVEGNYWGDTYWGQCPVGTGENHLGKLLMQVRSELT